MSKEAILDAINHKADEQAAQIVADAEAKAKARLSKVEAELKAEYEKKLSEVTDQIEQTVLGQKTLLRIDEKKSELSAKREIIDEVYSRVKQRICDMSDKDYLAFIFGIICKFGEDGDEVIICTDDERRITADWISDRAYDRQISLKLSSERHSDKGGVILRGKRYDKNLTLSALIEDAKRQTESYVVGKLFG